MKEDAFLSFKKQLDNALSQYRGRNATPLFNDLLLIVGLMELNREGKLLKPSFHQAAFIGRLLNIHEQSFNREEPPEKRKRLFITDAYNDYQVDTKAYSTVNRLLLGLKKHPTTLPNEQKAYYKDSARMEDGVGKIEEKLKDNPDYFRTNECKKIFAELQVIFDKYPQPDIQLPFMKIKARLEPLAAAAEGVEPASNPYAFMAAMLPRVPVNEEGAAPVGETASAAAVQEGEPDEVEEVDDDFQPGACRNGL